MPSFLCVCPDLPESLARRLEVRPQHLATCKPEVEAGIVEYGRPMLPPPGSKPHGITLPAGTPNIGGSFMVYKMDNLEACWDRLKQDVYYTANIWDKEKMQVHELAA